MLKGLEVSRSFGEAIRSQGWRCLLLPFAGATMNTTLPLSFCLSIVFLFASSE